MSSTLKKKNIIQKSNLHVWAERVWIVFKDGYLQWAFVLLKLQRPLPLCTYNQDVQKYSHSVVNDGMIRKLSKVSQKNDLLIFIFLLF